MGTIHLFSHRRFGACSIAFAGFIALLTASCSPTMTGTVKDDTSLTGQTQKLEAEGLNYSGPEYNVAIMTFENKTPSKVLGVGEAATDILRTIVKKSGLEPISLTEGEMKEQERLIAMQQTGAVKTGKKNAAEGFDPVDFRISGAVTSYSEVEEGSDLLVVKSKTQVARVQVDYALVDVASGKSLVADSGMGVYSKKTGGMFGLGSKSSADTGLRDGALRDAMTKAMTKMIKTLNEIPYQGRVLDVDGNNLIIRAGTKSKLQSGTVFTVYRPGKDLVDPDTGHVIGKKETHIGEIVLVSNQGDRLSNAKVKSGSDFRVGDIVRVMK